MTGPWPRARAIDASGRQSGYLVAAAPYVVPALLVLVIVFLALAT
jgi:hypothetical protein